MRFLMIVSMILFGVSCSGGDKHLPSSNPPEYDPKKVYTSQQAIPDQASDISATEVRPRRPVTESPIPQHAETRIQRQGALPTPAVELARHLLTGGSNGWAALLESVTASGFAVLDSRRRVVSGVPHKPEMGIPLEDWEVEILSRGVANQVTAPVSELEADIALAVKDERAGHLIMTMLLDEIRAGVNDSSPTVRTWAGLIVELGRQSPEPYDLLTVTDSSAVRLNGLQQVLILKHLSAEFFALAIQRATMPALSHDGVPSYDERNLVQLVSDSKRWTRRVSSLNAGDPCGFGTDQGIRTSEQASGWGWSLKFAFGPLRNLADEIGLMEAYRELSQTTDLRSIHHRQELISSGKAVDAELNKFVNTLSKLHNVATALLSLAELTAVMNAVKIDISMDPAPPLERTKTRQPGQYAKLTAALSFDLGELDLPARSNVACTSWLFAGVGLDFSMPENGPIKNADVEWTLVEGGLKMDSKAGHKITEAIVELENPGPRIQDAGVGFGDVKKSVRTNENGVAKVGIHGAPQKRDLGRNPQPVKKRATVRANVQLKPADIFRDLADALKGPWALPAQVLYRSHLLGKHYRFEVIDWLPPLRLLIHHRIRHDPQSEYSKAGWVQFDGTVQFEILLEPIAEGWFRGEIDVIRPLVVRHVSNKCGGSGSQTEHWQVSARIDQQTDLMKMRFSFDSSNRQAAWTCGSDIHVNLSGTILKSVQMSAREAAKKDFDVQNVKFLESLSITVVQGIDEQGK